MWFFVLFLLFVLLPFAELALLLLLADYTSWWWTLGLVIVTGIAGGALAKSQGLAVLRKIREEMAQGRIPAESLSDAAMILCAGCLLLTPGMITDVFGLSLLIPPIRRFYRRRIGAWIRSKVKISTQLSGRAPQNAAEPKPPGTPRPKAGSPFGIEEAVEVKPEQREE